MGLKHSTAKGHEPAGEIAPPLPFGNSADGASDAEKRLLAAVVRAVLAESTRVVSVASVTGTHLNWKCTLEPGDLTADPAVLTTKVRVSRRHPERASSGDGHDESSVEAFEAFTFDVALTDAGRSESDGDRMALAIALQEAKTSILAELGDSSPALHFGWARTPSRR